MISQEVINKIALLARLELTPQELELYTKQLGAVLEYVSELSKVKTEGIQPLVTPTDMPITFRPDEAVNRSGTEFTMANAPERSGNLFKVPPVL